MVGIISKERILWAKLFFLFFVSIHFDNIKIYVLYYKFSYGTADTDNRTGGTGGYGAGSNVHASSGVDYTGGGGGGANIDIIDAGADEYTNGGKGGKGYAILWFHN